MRVDVNPKLLRWACERSGTSIETLSERIPRLIEWYRGTAKPTLKQLEHFAKVTHAPIGYLFLSEPPVERMPIPDFRTVVNEHLDRPSPDLLDTIYLCQQRQEWFRDFARSSGEKALPFVGSARVGDDVEKVARDIRHALKFDIEERRKMATWVDALRSFIDQADSLGILVMCNGVVANDTHRALEPTEFRGFAMSDDLAPLVFINGKDTKAAQMFTLAHELAHIWIGQSAVSDVQASWVSEHKIERWCTRVAAELLVPLAVIKEEYRGKADLKEEMDRLARRFKVSTLVVLRRIYDAGGISQDQFRQIYQAEVERLKALVAKSGGGNFYLTQAARVSKRFSRALVVSTLEGQTLYRDALRMLGFSKMNTFRELGHSLGVG